MKKIKMIGLFKELSYGKGSELSVHNAIGGMPTHLRDKVCSYLKAGVLVAVSPGLTKDVLALEKTVIGPSAVMTDGEWGWYSDLSYYVEKYSVGLPDDFMIYAERSGWKVGAVDVMNIALR